MGAVPLTGPTATAGLYFTATSVWGHGER